MAIKHLTLSILTGGALMLGYAAWSKWRPTPRLAAAQPTPPLDSTPEVEGDTGNAALDELWEAPEPAANPQEELVDFTVELDLEDDDDGSVAPEDLGVRWLTRATEAMSPFAKALSTQGQADAALNAKALEAVEQSEAQPESQREPEDPESEPVIEYWVEKPA